MHFINLAIRRTFKPGIISDFVIDIDSYINKMGCLRFRERLHRKMRLLQVAFVLSITILDKRSLEVSNDCLAKFRNYLICTHLLWHFSLSQFIRAMPGCKSCSYAIAIANDKYAFI